MSADSAPESSPTHTPPSVDGRLANRDAADIVIQSHDFDSAALTARLRARTAGRAGALVTFTGYVRDFAPGRATHTLFLEHYPGMCERVLGEIVAQARQRWDVQDALITHRVGALANADQIVFVAVASAHRGDAFQACEFIMDALKTRAPFWKRETLADGEHFWVEARTSDADRASAWDSASPSSPDARVDSTRADATSPASKEKR